MTFFKNEGQYILSCIWCLHDSLSIFQPAKIWQFLAILDNLLIISSNPTQSQHLQTIEYKIGFVFKIGFVLSITFPNIILNFRTLCTSPPRPTYYLGHLFRLHDKNTALHTRHIWINVITKLIIQSIIKLHDLEDKLHPLQEIKSKSEWWSKL